MADEEKKKNENTMTDEEKSKCHKIIHTAAASAAAIGGGLAQIPGSDAVPITAIQVGMIIRLGAVFGTEVTEAAAKSILAGAVAAIGGRTVSQWLVGWIPLWGNAINAATAAAITEGIGWYVADDFADDAKKRDEKIRRLEKERKEAEIFKFEQEREEAEARKQSIVQMLMYFVVSALLAAMCGLDCFVLNYLKVSSLLANIFSGILIVLIVDALIYSMHLKNIMPMKSAGQLIFSSNFIAAVINIAGSLIYLAYDAKVREIIEGTIADTPFDKGKLISDSVKALGNMPFLNLGLVLFVSCIPRITDFSRFKPLKPLVDEMREHNRRVNAERERLKAMRESKVPE